MKRTLVCLLWGALLLVTGAAGAATLQFYVSPTGDDAAPGTKARPFATLTRARDAARVLAGRPRRILLRGGTYALTAPVLLGPEDSGLTILGAPGETPVLSGGRRLTGWTQEGDHFWSAPAPGTSEGTWDFRQLYVNGEARPRARLPEAGTWQHDSTPEKPPPTGDPLSTLLYREGQLPADFSLRNAEIIILYVQWDEAQVRAVANDPVARVLSFAPPCPYPPGSFNLREYYVLNLREGLTRPGQWYLDRDRGRVVYWPLPGEDPRLCTVEAPGPETLLRVVGSEGARVTNLTLQGFTLDLTTVGFGAGWGAMSSAGALELSYVRDCRLLNLTVRRAGGQGIKIVYADDTSVESCEVMHTGANGLLFGEGAHNEVLNTQVRHVGEVYAGGIGINTRQFTYSRLAHNEVSDCAYCGIALGNANGTEPPTGNVVEDNLVSDVMTRIDDGGCLYFYGAERGTVVRGNVLHGARGRTGYAMGLYLDEHVEEMVCEDNVVYDIARYPVFVHEAKRAVIRNNLFVCEPGGIVSFLNSSDCLCEGNLVYAPETRITFFRPEGARFHRNFYFAGPAGMETPPDPDPVMIPDPLFVDAAHGDFRLREGSPELPAGFHPIDMTHAGLEK